MHTVKKLKKGEVGQDDMMQVKWTRVEGHDLGSQG